MTNKLQHFKKDGFQLVTLYQFTVCVRRIRNFLKILYYWKNPDSPCTHCTSQLINLFRYVPSNVHAQVSCRYPIEKIGVDRKNIAWSYRPENGFYQLESINKNSLGGSMVFSLQYFVRKPKKYKELIELQFFKTF